MSDNLELFDLVIIGGGVSCAHTLSALLQEVKGAKRPLRICVIEKDGEFWRGFPYGRRSSINSLIITTLNEFVPDAEFDAFVAWLIENRPSWTARMRAEGGSVARRWLSENEAAMNDGDWGEVYVPRRLYGDFIEARMNAQIAEAAQQGGAEVVLLSASAESVARRSDGYTTKLENGAAVESRCILLAVGSPPSRVLNGATDLGRDVLYINNAYLPSLDENLARMRSQLQSLPRDRNVLIVGSNATSLEIIYMLSRDERLTTLLEKVVVLSRSGAFPHRMTRDRFRVSPFPRMSALIEQGRVNGPDILAAAEADLDELSSSADETGDRLHHLSGLLVALLAKMSADEERRFHHKYGMAFTRLVRRAGAEYRGAVDEMAAAGRLVTLRGDFERLSPVNGQMVRAIIFENGEQVATPDTFAVVINCAGFEEVGPSSSSSLLAGLVDRNLVAVNPTGRGIQVDDAYAAAPGLVVCGPLLAGVFHENAKFWHVENVRRIHAMAAFVASALASQLETEDITS